MSSSRLPLHQWRSRRAEAIVRDDFECQDCFCQGELSDGTLEVHHIIPKKEGGSDELDNLITLCVDCHNDRHSVENESIMASIVEFVNQEPRTIFEVENNFPLTRGQAEYRLNVLASSGDIRRRNPPGRTSARIYWGHDLF